MFGGLGKRFKEWWNRPPSEEELRRMHRHDSHGTADWAGADYDDFGEYHNGVFLGGLKTRHWNTHDDKGRPLQHIPGRVVGIVYSKPETNVMICAPPGTGKGTTIIIPTLLDYQQSVFVIDPKGENAAVTMRTRRDEFKQTVHVLNPWGMHGIPSAKMNPLDLLDRDDINCVSNAVFLADLIMLPNPGGKDSFWDESAKTILVGLMLYIIGYEPQSDTLSNLRRLVTLPDQEFERIAIKMAASELFEGALAEAGGTILGMDKRTRSNVMATAQAHTAFLADPVIKQATSASDFNFRDLKEKRTTVYVNHGATNKPVFH